MAKLVTVREWNGMRVDVWRMDAGDKIDRHSHPFVHSTGVVCGSTKISLFESVAVDGLFSGTVKDSRVMLPGDKDFAFPSNVEHEIEALEDGTIIVNMQFTGLPGRKGNDGGIATDD